MQLSSVTYISPEQLCHWSTVFNGILDDLDLHGYGWQHGFLQTVKLVKTSPRSTLHQTNEDPPHGFHIYTLFMKTFSRIIFCNFALYEISQYFQMKLNGYYTK